MSDVAASSETFCIPALHCGEEFALIRTGLRPLKGIQQVVPDYVNRTLRVEFDPESLDAATIAEQLRRLGFPAQPPAWRQSNSQHAETPRLRATTLTGGILLLAAAIVHLAWADPVWVAALAIASTALSGWPVAQAALRAVRLGRMDINALMTIAAVGAIAIGEWFEAATAVFLFGVALWLESYTIGRARHALQRLVELTPTIAHRIERPPEAFAGLARGPGREAEDSTAGVCRITDVDPQELAVGDHVLIKPGERAPIDGEVAAGRSAMNQAPITGESMPVEKWAGQPVFAGSLNGEGALEIRATKLAGDSTLAQAARLVEQAQAARSPTERFIDRFAQRYTPAVIALAVAIALGPLLLAQTGLVWTEGAAVYDWKDWVYRALVLLVIACPCALVISTPITIVCGLHQAARQGMIIKGGQFLEAAGQVDCVAIDKTGTLTAGQPQVVEVRAAAGRGQEQVLRLAAALETRSEHPLAAAIVSAARQRGLSWPPASQISALRGFGVQGTVEGQTYFVASPRFFQEQRFGGDAADRWLEADGALTVALVGDRRRILGAIYLADQPRADAAASIADLKRLGVKSVVMLTGDSRAVADRIARSVGIDRIYAELLPAEKVACVEALAADFPHLAMVGDGVNDAPALAASKLGVALGAQASDTALETADIVIMSPRLSRLAQLLQLGRRTRRVLGQNIFLALSIKAAVLILASLGLATMWMAVAADVGASMLVIFNGMRLLSPFSGR